jgi:tRNA A37 threonylcarbamoyladenosine biosynthesis protein TsaE
MLNNPFENTMVVLIGFAGTGKYTIGRELCERTGAKLIDNHLIANPVFTVVNADGVTPLPAGVWDKIKQIRRTVYDAIRELSPPEMSFVFTVEWRENNPADLVAFADLERLAAARRSRFIPIRLICGVEELCRRVVDPARVALLKEISPELARKKSAEDAVLNVSHPNLRTLDVTKRSASGSVDAILDETSSIKSVWGWSLASGGTDGGEG